MFEQLQKINIDLLNYFNSLINNGIIKKIVIYFADLPIFLLPIFLLVAWIFWNYKKDNIKKQDLLFIFYSTVLAILISLLIQQFVLLDRPEQHLKNSMELILKHIPDASFPSDHASVSMAFLTALFLAWYKKIAFIFLPFFIIMLLSRIIAWIHWPFDILAWTIVWIFSACIMFKFIKKCKILIKLNDFIIKIMRLAKL